MRFTDKIKYNIKRGLPILAIAGAGLMASCDKDDEPNVPQHDVELKFFSGYVEEVTPENIKANVQDKSVRHIYLVVANGGKYFHYSPRNITDLHEFIEERINIAPNKISGRGNMQFEPGYASTADSLWFVKHGYTVNQKQK